MKRSKNIKLQRDILNIWTWRFWEQTIEKLARAWRASLMREIDTSSRYGAEQTENAIFRGPKHGNREVGARKK